MQTSKHTNGNYDESYPLHLHETQWNLVHSSKPKNRNSKKLTSKTRSIVLKAIDADMQVESGFEMHEVTDEKTYFREVRWVKSEFKLKAWLLQFGDTKLEKTLIIEVNYSSWRNHPITRDITRSFWSMINIDYLEKAKKIISEYCKENWLIINHKLYDLPTCKVVASKI